MKKIFAVKKAGAICAVIAAVLAMPNLSARADSLTENGTISTSLLGGSVATDLSQFNTGLGTLTGVQITLDFNVTPFIQLLNFSSSPQTFIPSDVASVSFDPSDSWTVSYASDNWTLAAPTVTTGPISGSGQVVSGFGNLMIVGGTSAAADLTSVSGLDLAAYEGVGDLVFGATGTGSSSTPGPFFGGANADLAGTASVTYTFTAVPEPATLTMFGLCGLAVMLRKRLQS